MTALEILGLERHGQARAVAQGFVERHERSWIAERFRRYALAESSLVPEERSPFWIS